MGENTRKCELSRSPDYSSCRCSFFQKCRHVKTPPKLKSNPELVQREGWTREGSLWRSLYGGHQEPFCFDLVWLDTFRSSYSYVLIIFRPQSKTFRRALVTQLLLLPSQVCSYIGLQAITRWSWYLLFQYQYSLEVVAEVRSWNSGSADDNDSTLCISIPHFLGVSYHTGTHTTGPQVWPRHS